MTITLPTPTPKQIEFIKDSHKYVCFGGARGGGKSVGIRIDVTLYACKYNESVQYIFRRSYPELQRNHISKLRKMYGKVVKYNDQRKEFTFPNGSQIICAYASNIDDLRNYQGLEADRIFIDEATQMPEDVFKQLSACLRGVNDYPHSIKLTCNPGGVGHAFVKRLWLDRKFIGKERAEDYSFIQSKVYDNLPLMKANPDYVEQLEALPLALREAWLEGNWNVFQGAVFSEFRDDPSHYDDRHWTHVINPFPIPQHWTIYRAYDHGYRRPFACSYYAVDPDGCAYNFYEFYGWTGEDNVGLQWSTDKIFTEIRNLEEQHPLLKGRHIIGIADPAIWQTQTGESIADTASKYGVFFSPGDNKRIAGWMMLHNYLRFNKDGLPNMYFFRNCENIIRTLPLMQYSETKPEDVETDSEDHLSDACRYFCMARPMKGIVPEEDDGFMQSPLHRIFKLNREDL